MCGVFNGRALRELRAEKAAATERAQGGGGAAGVAAPRQVSADGGEPRPVAKVPPRKLPPVPTFSAAKPGESGTQTNGVVAAGKGKGAEKASDAISLLLDEYDESDD